MTTLSLRSIAHALGGDVCGREVLCPGPGHSRKDRSLGVALARDADKMIVVRSFAGDDWQTCRDHVCGILGIEVWRKGDADSGVNASVMRMQARERQRIADAEKAADDAIRTARALSLWEQGSDPRATPAEAYLQSRGVELPDEAAGVAIRFLASCPFVGQRAPALVCLARDMQTDEPKAIHRTALDDQGNGIEVNGHKRLSLGPVGGCAIKLTADAVVGTEIGVGEGLETVLSLRRIAGPQLALWALLPAGNMPRLPLLRGVRKVWIATDHDPAGLKASRIVAREWRSAGREAARIIPNTPKLDLNDLVMGGRIA